MIMISPGSRSPAHEHEEEDEAGRHPLELVVDRKVRVQVQHLDKSGQAKQISSRYFLTFFSRIHRRRDNTLLRMSKPWWAEGRHLQYSSNVGWARGGRPGLSLGEMTLIWNFKMKNINKILPQTISRPPTLLRYHFEGTLYPSVLANGNT